VTEATKSLSQAAALDWACQITIAESGSESVEKSASQPSKTSLPTPCAASISRERCLQPHSKQRRISQPPWDRTLLLLHRRQADHTPAALHNRAATPTIIKLRQTRRHHQHVGHPGDPAAMAQPRIILPNKHSIIHRLAAPHPRRR
jgi:hypothetical protein